MSLLSSGYYSSGYISSGYYRAVLSVVVEAPVEPLALNTTYRKRVCAVAENIRLVTLSEATKELLVTGKCKSISTDLKVRKLQVEAAYEVMTVESKVNQIIADKQIKVQTVAADNKDLTIIGSRSMTTKPNSRKVQ